MFKNIVIILSLSFYVSAADLDYAPDNFYVENHQATFVDFQEAEYKLVFDRKKKRAYVLSEIKFYQAVEGNPLFDSRQKPEWVWVDGEEVEASLISTPRNETQVRMVNKTLTAGSHTLKVISEIEIGVKFRRRGVSAGFFILDLSDRNMLERYVPTNYEYDHYKMDFHVKVINSRKGHDVFTNGDVERLSKNDFKISFPEYFTASSLYFHLVPKRKFRRMYFNFKSMNGKVIPVTLYSSFRLLNRAFKRKTIRVLKELERDYGPYPHDKLVIYGTNKIKGGMEYVGATATSYVSLDHELLHMWFAKGVMPRNGNSGWMDEGIASWRDRGYKTALYPFYNRANLGGHSQYTRKTDDRSYRFGRSFFGYIDRQLKANGMRLKDFLKSLATNKMHTSITTEEFLTDLQNFSDMSFQDDFNRYVYGERDRYESDKDNQSDIIPENEHHPKRTLEELESLL